MRGAAPITARMLTAACPQTSTVSPAASRLPNGSLQRCAMSSPAYANSAYAPMATARLGLDVLGFQLGADARVVRRWQIGAPDHTQWQLGAFIGATWESKDRRPRY